MILFTLVVWLQTIKRNEPEPHSDSFLGFYRWLYLGVQMPSTTQKQPSINNCT